MSMKNASGMEKKLKEMCLCLTMNVATICHCWTGGSRARTHLMRCTERKRKTISNPIYKNNKLCFPLNKKKWIGTLCESTRRYKGHFVSISDKDLWKKNDKRTKCFNCHSIGFVSTPLPLTHKIGGIGVVDIFFEIYSVFLCLNLNG